MEESMGWDSNMTTDVHPQIVIGGGSENTLEGSIVMREAGVRWI